MKFFNFGRIGKKLLITSTISGVFFIVYAFFCLWEIDHQFTANAQMQVEIDEIETSLHTLYQSLLTQESGQRGYNLTGAAAFLESFQEGTTAYNEIAKILLQKIENKPEIKTDVNHVIEKGRYWYEQYGLQLVNMTGNGQHPSLELLQQSKLAFDEFRDALQGTIVLTGNLRVATRDAYIAKISQAKSMLLILAVFLIALNAFIINRQTKSIIQPVLLLNKSVKAYTQKDFSVSIPNYKKADELAELIENVNTMRLELNEKFSTIESLADLDGNTGLYNRRYFDQTFENEWMKAKNNSKPISLILFDVDFFKNYNDTYGHLEGDKCLKRISNRLLDLFGDGSDIVARYGGEEFAIVLPEQSAEIAYTKAEKCRKAIMDLRITHQKSYVNNVVTISVGVASMNPTKGNRKSTHLIALADKALYKSKENGRNQVTQYSVFSNNNRSTGKTIRKKHS